MKPCKLAGQLMRGPAIRHRKLSDVVFLHCLLGNRKNFAVMCSLEHIWGEQRRLFSLDLRNHGESCFEDSMLVHQMATDLLDWLEANHIQQPILAGHSLGGKVAIEAAMLAPELLSGLVILDVAPVAYTQESFTAEPVSIVRYLEELQATGPASLSALEALLAERFPQMPMFADFLLQSFHLEAGTPRVALNLPAIKRSISELFAHETKDRTYRGRTVIVHGRKSNFFTRDMLPQVRRCFPELDLDSDLFVVDCGHYVNFKRPSEVSGIIEGFASRIERLH